MNEAVAVQRGGRRGRGGASSATIRKVDYHNLRSPFTPQRVFSDDRVAAIHNTALRVLEDLGIRILLPEARAIFAAADALVDEETQMVRIGRDLVTDALAAAPRSIHCHAGVPDRDVTLELGVMTFIGGSGAPNVTDRERGRRAGTLQDFSDFVRLVQGFDALQIQGAYVEPQDVDIRFRHYAVTRAQLTLSDKLPFVFARGTPQVEDGFEMIRLARGLSRDAFRSSVHCYTVINTNSPRQLDIPMAQGIIDFARAGQVSIITPFCLAGAMAPITVAGALTLQHAEALAGITLAQLARRGAPVVYGSFSSNVDMKSGAPAFGTPEHVKATLGAGQLARYLGLPWRSGGGSAANVSDAQAAHESQFALWGSVLAGATVCIHAAGWLEGGLSVSFEKLVTDLEALQTIAELCRETPGDDNAIGFDAIAEVQPGGHFFAAAHTMSRYRDAFYEPLVADWQNFGNWTQSGSRTATERATDIWKRRLAEFTPPASAAMSTETLDAFIARRTAEGGAPPVS
ncbi:trimethylamine methyltransferase family protein [Mesorhizobium sp. LHD-90]|uniref:trimethylamine methyltransferase family protein n=1 Tax=Mesorhizobium sp. LHD-90 TaxID=3071414 RepID=UPI0027E1D99F|nr:trimethylamine methyltransferase family protein [Mesorhizobium sp. LHD-90]MDQ6437369.1 trimethylamine methyltransferase family protein [Mesorhizobium sp. LHD-90]